MKLYEQLRQQLLLIGVVCATIVTVAVLAHMTPVIQNHVARELILHRETNGHLIFDGGYIDDGDYVLLRQLPYGDFSRGGVYFIGASEMKVTLMPWLLPRAERKLIHNYSIGDFRHREVRHYVGMLVDEFGLLRAGANKTTIFIGLSYQMARIKDFGKRVDRYVEYLFERHGLYSYDWNGGIHRSKLAPVVRFVRLQRDCANRFLRFVAFPSSRVVPGAWPVEGKRAHLIRAMGQNWREVMRAEVAELEKLLDYLQSLGVRVRVVFPPDGSWQAKLPYDAVYREMVIPLLSSRSIPVIDQKNLLWDDEYHDHVHARYWGQLKLHRAYRELALQALREMGTELETQPGDAEMFRDPADIGSCG